MTLKDYLLKDVELSQRFLIPENKTGLKKIAAFFAHSGDSWFWGAGLALLWIFGPQKWRPWIQLLFIGILVTAICVLILKFTIKRPRPEGDWGQIYRSSDPHSFPSGHAARATMLAILILLAGPSWLGLVMIVWALLVAISRIGLGVHFISDILGGAILGILFGGVVFIIFG
ncbi:MAG: phosphatase PAP2 family protein [Anaerolineales bacterium]|nr:phosphatase PAP2 family protein [Anaerolineales bacterium]